MPTFLTGLTAKLIGVGLLVMLIGGLWLRGNAFENQRDKERIAHRQTIENVKRAQDHALAAAVTARNAAERRYAALAEKGNANAQAVRKVSDSATDRFIAGNRCLRAEEPRSASGQALAAAPDRSAGVPASVPPIALVAVTDADVRAVGELAAYAIAAREWALSLGE